MPLGNTILYGLQKQEESRQHWTDSVLLSNDAE